jgi:hypothetical protein
MFLTAFRRWFSRGLRTAAVVLAAASLTSSVDAVPAGSAVLTAGTRGSAYAELKRTVLRLDALPEFTTEAVEKVLGIKFRPGSNNPVFNQYSAGIPEGPFGVVVLSRVANPTPQSSYRDQIGLGIRPGVVIREADLRGDLLPAIKPDAPKKRVSPLEPDEVVVEGSGRRTIYSLSPGDHQLMGIKLQRF